MNAFAMLQSLLRVACILTVSLGGLASAVAQSPPPEALAAAKELVMAARAADQIKMMAPLMAQSLRPAIVQGRSPEFARDYDAILPGVLDRAMSRLDDLVDVIAVIYAKNFTLADLKEITAFYKSPIGQKMLERQPIIAQQSMAAGQAFARALMDDIRPRLIEELRKKGHSI